MVSTRAAELARHPAVLDRVESILGPDLLVWMVELIVKQPHSDKILTMHQDLNYWGFDHADREVTAWIALTDVTVANGAMSFVRGSHRLGSVDHHDTYGANNLLSRGQQVSVEHDPADEVAVELAAGEISLHDHLISCPGFRLPSEQRRVGMVFQDFALFPHLNVRGNVGFGLNSLAADARRARIDKMLRLVGLSAQSDRYPHELSGGQQQRVALARALAPDPEILLLDEPFASLDTDLREQLACEVRDLLKANNVTAILVTHDQHEAFAMSDHIALLKDGELIQAGTPYQLYHDPVSEFVAGFVGQGAMRSPPPKPGRISLSFE